MSGVVSVTVTAEDAGQRLDRWFARHYPHVGFGVLQKLLRTGQVRVDGRRAKPGVRLVAGQVVRVPPLPRPPPGGRAKPLPVVAARDVEDLRSRILHRDEHVLVIDKPAGLAVQGGSKTLRHLDAMLDALRFDAPERPRLVHRLDKDTSGVLVLARTLGAAGLLSAAFRERTARKVYWAVVAGVPHPPQGRIDAPLSKLPGRGGERMAPDRENGRKAVTEYRMLDHAGRVAAWLEMEPATGRTHQLRAHAALLGTPIVGDGKYGATQARLQGLEDARRLHLHARSLSVPHPAGGVLEVVAPLPAHMARTFAFLGFDAGLME